MWFEFFYIYLFIVIVIKIGIVSRLSYFKNYIWNTNILTSSGHSILVGLPTPLSINYYWNFGSILLIILRVQLIRGVLLAMRYIGSAEAAFGSVDRILREISSGWIIRSVHSNGASFFFLFMFLHIGRGLYYGSYRKEETWLAGVTILLISMGVAFLGYVLPWGQMSFWAATVITNFVSSIPYIGKRIVIWLWGGYSVGGSTLTRFFALHYILPFVIVVLVLLHKVLAHEVGSKRPLGIKSKGDKVKFHRYFSWKDILGFAIYLIILNFFFILLMNLFLDPENFIEAKSLVTPVHIQPEWYFLASYAILRSIPKKLGGVIALAGSICIFYVVPFITRKNVRGFSRKFLLQFLFFSWVKCFIILSWIGSKPVEDPFSTIGAIFSFFYFSFFLVFLLPMPFSELVVYSKVYQIADLEVFF